MCGLLHGGQRDRGPLYTVTDLGVRQPVALNDAGQVALTDSKTITTATPYGGLSYQQTIRVGDLLQIAMGHRPGRSRMSGSAAPVSGNGIPWRDPPGDWSSGITSSGQVLDVTYHGTYLTDGKDRRECGAGRS